MNEHLIHSLHKTRGTVLFDDCEACKSRAGTLDLDEDSLRWLGQQAEWVHDTTSAEYRALSMAERWAIARLRHMARIVFRSGITEEVAR